LTRDPDFTAAVNAGFVLAGTPDEVADGLRREIETAGINYVLTRFAFGNLSFEEELRSATLFAREVMPRFARETAAA
jgi:alkanesulfonate monooxygenase SsuD/methylene tetrahydromethanopterin reductase-like flavin-dependent oxidoreductase (luciferase family)